MSTRTLTMQRTFAAPRERIFEAFTKSEALMQWFGPKSMSVPIVELDVRVGGRYRLEMHGEQGIYVLSGEYREVVPPEKLVFTWIWAQGDIAGIESVVTITLAARLGGTELTLVHDGLPTEAAQTAHNQGWISTFDCLNEMLAGRPKIPKLQQGTRP